VRRVDSAAKSLSEEYPAMSERPVLILVPGLLCDADLWVHQKDHLADIADIRIADVTQRDTMAAMAADILADAPPRFALAGLSMGGYVAHAIMAAAPERVSRLALLDTSAIADSPEAVERRKALIEMSKVGTFRGVTDRLLPVLVHPDRLTDGTLTGRVKAMAEHVSPEAFFRQQTAIMGRLDRRDAIRGYELPTLVMCGCEDALTPLALHEEMAGSIPGARLAVIEQCGHLSTMERPQAATALLRDWLLYDR
jgi:pimeloyl-ACP methyl ester carboxylesterase